MLYALTIFLGAFLLFLVQPLIGKYILPWFGGGPGVWTTCLLFFQTLLLAGYAYAHFTSTRLKPRTQALTHLVLLALSLAWLPIIPDTAWKPAAGDEPTRRILLLLTATLGLPYLLLSATGPLLQRWFSLRHPGQSPYRLYALSNVGSLLALLGYPFAIEPLLARSTQAWGWSAALVLFAGLCGACAWQIRRADPPAPAAPATADDDTAADQPTRLQRFFWLALPAVASVLLVATTSKLCVDVAVIPFLWVLPLALYLLSFILCFDHPRWYARGVFAALFVLACVAVGYFVSSGLHAPIAQQITGYCAALFVACMICHGEAYRLRPAPRHLTSFYLHLATGGALGGFFVAVVAPLVFNDYYELHLGYWALAYLLAALALVQRSRTIVLGIGAGTLAGVALLPLFFLGRATEPGPLAQLKNYYATYHAFYVEYRWWAAAVLLVLLWSLRGAIRARDDEWRVRFSFLPLALTALLGAVFFIQITGTNAGLIDASRNFYGTLKVRPFGEPGSISYSYLLSHGITTHGLQFARPPYNTWATTYYGPKSGIGLALEHAAPKPGGRRFGFVGLGAGTLAAYGQAGDQLRIYEINPAVLHLARERFTYLTQTAADVKIVLGDARLAMEDELAHDAPQHFDVLALDAFSSDAIPVHLLTAEAFAVYLKHLQPDGVIAVHISNRYLDLRPVVEALAQRYQLSLVTLSNNPKDDEWWLYRTTWMLLSRDPLKFAHADFQDAADEPPDETAQTILWTDDRASLVGILR
ncbi:spermidine synthase [Oleiharenicola sp. Vm1]|uniref:spermidine synthase n=1 Tax=Oleiharenicola sp. Vm1 TaxID=3398393 RepID=UPI0039F5B2EA